MNKNICSLVFVLACWNFSMAQDTAKTVAFTRQDSLRGSNGPGRWQWDILHYDITVKPDYNSKSISGKNEIRFMDSGVKMMQLDLQEPMILDSIVDQYKKYPFRREGNVYWVEIRDSSARYKIKVGPRTITAYFHGTPRQAIRAPWDGGWIWARDKQQNPWMSVACQGLGASVWYPCKDYQGDEPDSGAILRMIVPDTLTAIGNGRLIGKDQLPDQLVCYNWEVKNPINNYNIIPYIGKYSHFGESYDGLKGKLDMDYWVLSYNLDKARKQFMDAPRMMKAFEYWFGAYPFYEDGYKMVEAPHLGMEHQSAIAYGNGYMNGYLGTDLSATGWGLKWDFIIIHESGHEWFGNNITTKDIADMWVHESFTNYSETLFTDYHYGNKAGNEYCIGNRKSISNDEPIVGPYGVNKEGSGDMYPKGGNMIHNIRQVINNDKKFRKVLHELYRKFYHATVTGSDVEALISKKSGIDFSTVFEQYLRTTKIPELEYKIENNEIVYRWQNTVPGFKMPLKVSFGEGSKEKWIRPAEQWQRLKPGKNRMASAFLVDPNFYIKVKMIP